MNTLFMEMMHEFPLKGYGSAGDMMDTLVSVQRFQNKESTERKELITYVGDVDVVEKKIKDYLKQDGFTIMSFPSANATLCYREKSEVIVSYVRYTISNSTLTFVCMGEESSVQKYHEWAYKNFHIEGSYVKVAAYAPIGGGIVYDKNFLVKNDQRLARASFYPWIDEPLKDYFQAFIDSPESVLILLGPPGTGKSTFLRSLIVETGVEATLAYNKQVIESPQLMSDFFSSDSKILAYEDIDNHLKARDENNDLMATILNMSEGIVKHQKKKIVFSTNLPSTDKIDPALLRKGRCFDVAKFRELTYVEALNVWEEMGLPEKPFQNRNSMSLAEILSTEDDRLVGREGRRHQSAGFINT